MVRNLTPVIKVFIIDVILVYNKEMTSSVILSSERSSDKTEASPTLL